MARLSALLTTEGSYPFHGGDVSTWCDALLTALHDVDFTVIAVTTHPYLPLQHHLGANVRTVITVPVSGMEDPAEYGNHASLPDYLRRRVMTASGAIESDYIQHLEYFLRQVVHEQPDGSDLGRTLLELHLHLRHGDYHLTQTHPATWDAFTRILRDGWREAQPGAAAPSTAEIVMGWRLFYRLMLPLAVNVPRVDLAHAAAPGFCGLPCVMAKLRWGTPYLLTEHGAYVREHYLRTTSDASTPFVRWFFGRLTSAVVDVNYAAADQISPVCRRTAEWTRWRGVDGNRIRTIHHGVRSDACLPVRDADSRPTIVSIGEFSPLTAQLELIEAVAVLRRTAPDIQLRLYGPVDDEAYFQRCRQLVAAMKLEGAVVFAAGPSDVADALRQADVFALTSVSEGLPYALLSAMLAQKAIVATDAGGVREAIGEAGVIVPPGDTVALVEALGTLLQMRDTARRFGEHARERALKLFTEERWVEAYRASYDRLSRLRQGRVAQRPDEPVLAGRSASADRPGAQEPEPAVAEIRRTAGERRSYRREAARLRA